MFVHLEGSLRRLRIMEYEFAFGKAFSALNFRNCLPEAKGQILTDNSTIVNDVCFQLIVGVGTQRGRAN